MVRVWEGRREVGLKGAGGEGGGGGGLVDDDRPMREASRGRRGGGSDVRDQSHAATV